MHNTEGDARVRSSFIFGEVVCLGGTREEDEQRALLHLQDDATAGRWHLYCCPAGLVCVGSAAMREVVVTHLGASSKQAPRRSVARTPHTHTRTRVKL